MKPIEPHSEGLFNLFGLNHSETELYFSLLRILTRQDIQAEQGPRKKKEFWLDKYLGLIRLERSLAGTPLKVDLSDEEISKRLSLLPKSKRAILLFEARNFMPYFTLNIRHEELDGLKKGYLPVSADSTRLFLDKLAAEHGLDPKRIQTCEKAYGDTIKQIRGDLDGFDKAAITIIAAIAVAATAGYAAPAIGSYVGSLLGFWGCAATSAGLAFLGGGALAVGGFGMAGGTIVIIGGGFILGGTSSVAILSIIDQDSPFVLQNVSKLEAIVRVLLLGEPGLSALVEKIIKSYVEGIKRIKDAIATMVVEESVNHTDEYRKNEKRRRKELDRSLKYYEMGVRRLRSFQAETLDIA